MDRTNINERLKGAAQEGDIDLLYTLIQEDPHIFENIDSIPFVDTPLHVSASFGQLRFATEVMRLRPSFAGKLNQQGLSPIHLAMQQLNQQGFCPDHLAMQQRQKRTVLRLVDINRDIVRVKGREGLTPLHLASQAGDVDLLARFLFACPDSIEDVTAMSETALHVAVKNKQYEALRVLVGWLNISRQKDALHLEIIILDWKDEEDNTILHVTSSTRNNDPELVRSQHMALRLLVKSRINLNAKNLENSTALDIAASAEINRILRASGAKSGLSVTDSPSRADKLRSNITITKKILISILRVRSNITEKNRNAILVVAALVATAGFQTALNPPGGVYPASVGYNNNVTTTSLNSTATATPQGNVGKSVMSPDDFYSFFAVSEICIVASTLIIYILIPVDTSGKAGNLVLMPIYWFICCYLYSIKRISPASNSSLFFYLVLSLLVSLFIGLYLMFGVLYKRLQYHPMDWETKRRNRITGGNRW